MTHKEKYQAEVQAVVDKNKHADDFYDTSKAPEDRIKAIEDWAMPVGPADSRMLHVVCGRSEDQRVRVAGLRKCNQLVVAGQSEFDSVMSVLEDQSEPGDVRLAVIRAMMVAAFSCGEFEDFRGEYISVLEGLAEDPDDRVREAAGIQLKSFIL